MNPGFYLQTSRIEDTHWWFVHRRRLVVRLLDRFAGQGRADRRGLDVGCGSGGNLHLLERYCSTVTGVDRSEYALEIARTKLPGAGLVRADANALEDRFAAASFDLVTVFNVLYHRWIDSDEAVLAQIGRLLRPGGMLVLTEPANETLFRRHDELDFGARRYRLDDLKRKTERAGLAVRSASYFNALGFPPAYLLARLERWTGRAGSALEEDEEAGEMRHPAPPLNGALLGLLWPERVWIGSGGRVPFGVSVLILARRESAATS